MNGASGGLGLCKLGQGPAGSEEESFSGLTEAFSPPNPLSPTQGGYSDFLFSRNKQYSRRKQEVQLSEVLSPNHPFHLPLKGQSPNFVGTLKQHGHLLLCSPKPVVQMGKLTLRRGRALLCHKPVAGLGPDLRSGLKSSLPGV